MIDLFEPIQSHEALKCARCGSVNHNPRSKYCSHHCKVSACNRRADERLREIRSGKRLELFNEAALQEWQREAIALYRDKRLGLKTICKLIGRAQTPVRRILIKSGVYNPPAKNITKKGCGKYSDQPNVEELARREVEKKKKWREKWAHKLAVCLWSLRRGIPIEATLKQNGWNKTVWNYLRLRKSYKRFDRGEVKYPKVDYGAMWSLQYPKEDAFQDKIEALLIASGIKYEREWKLPNCRTRVDFRLDGDVFIECKVAVRSGQVYEAIGQVVHYKSIGATVFLVVPDDVQIRSDLKTLLMQHCNVTNEANLLRSIQHIGTPG
jgi:hypothetical protein